MPIIANAKKALRQSKSRAIRNKVVRAKVRTAIKGDNLTSLFSVVDKAVKRHLINKNKAARIKSRAAHRLVQAVSPEKPVAKKSIKPVVKKAAAKPAAAKKTATKAKKAVKTTKKATV